LNMSETASIILLASAVVVTIAIRRPAMIPFTAISSSNSENGIEKEEHPLAHVLDRGPINHNFAPDESCTLNASIEMYSRFRAGLS
jgi:hypothetical protein